MEELMPEPGKNEPNCEPTELVLITQGEEDNMGTHTPTEHGEDVELHKPVEQNNEALTDITSSPDQVLRTKPNILDILNDE